MLKQRFITAVIALGVLLCVLFLVPEIVAEIFIALLALAGAWEWSAFLDTTSRLLRAFFVVVIAALITAVSMLWPDSAVLVLRIALAWWVAALVWTFFFPTRVPQVLRWLGGAFVLVPFYAALRMLYEIDPRLLLFALLIVWAADMGAYFVGKRFGRVKLAPRISPGKTWEGVFGGLVLAIFVTFGGRLVFEANLAVLLPFVVAIAGVSIVGDLTVSMFKRTSGLKDSGNVFPGHGGVLDRIDSVAAALPLFALGLGWMGLV